MDPNFEWGPSGTSTHFTGVPDGFDAYLLAELLNHATRPVLHVSSDDLRMNRLAETIAIYAPNANILKFPAWDCLPYDRVPPRAEIVSERMASLGALTTDSASKEDSPTLVLTTASAILQRIPPRARIIEARIEIIKGRSVDLKDVMAFLVANGFHRTETVREPGEFASRGDIIDLFPPGNPEPARIDLFGDDIEGLRHFDPLSQLTTENIESLTLLPASEILLDQTAIANFRSSYRAHFGAVRGDDPLYEAVSQGLRHPGMEHWLPLFYTAPETLFDYIDGPMIVGGQADDAMRERFDQIADYFTARANVLSSDQDETPYNPLPPDALYIGPDEWADLCETRTVIRLDGFEAPKNSKWDHSFSGRRTIDFSEARNRADTNLFDAVRTRIRNEQSQGQSVVIACHTNGSRDRMVQLLVEHGMDGVHPVGSWEQTTVANPDRVPVCVLPLERGFTLPGRTVYSEQDILGDRLIRRRRRTKSSEHLISEMSSMSLGDIVVHNDHGIGRYDGLKTLEIGGAPHDCLCLLYAGDDKLFLPVENLDLLTRYGSEGSSAQLDKLGNASWQVRHARVKNRITEMAGKLMTLAAKRELRHAPKLTPPVGLYEEFCARFPFSETEDQNRAIEDTLASLAAGKPMDRLVCGDVGFGKTEVALRAAFVTALSGRQVAVVVPTTLLARQHSRTFEERFRGLPVRIAQLSRLTIGKEAQDVRNGLESGQVDIVIGTHALLSQSVAFKDLGLLVVDEEQHFGVAQKERLKGLGSDVHVLTLTATPIPRTLQLALTGVRELSLIATPPVDRLAIRTFILPYDGMTIREAIMREHFRGGQSFYICPRIDDIERLHGRLKELVPEVNVGIAHGQMPARALEDVMTAFYDRKYGVLLCTNIVESGLDVPSANTIIVHRSDMFGLSQLYQLRGRVGRSKTRAYAYLTLPNEQLLSETARQRLDVMQTLDTLGAGFSLASHDLDIRGAGNLLGEEQSGHIREVGVELYQQMLEDAVAAAREAGSGTLPTDEWTPVISIGAPILIPDHYVSDLSVRLGLYRRIASLVNPEEIDLFAVELVDRFGPIPNEVENLLEAIALKRLCRDTGVAKLDAGPKGAVVTFRDNDFSNPAGLVAFISEQGGAVKLRPDHKLVYRRDWSDEQIRSVGIRNLMRNLAAIAAETGNTKTNADTL
ncbi:MAG: transcription-repair coupling factor [Alphaproteobacteria bacterium]|nr:transcription-repair coupling factor [Alphaproteobacteria bacterium]